MSRVTKPTHFMSACDMPLNPSFLHTIRSILAGIPLLLAIAGCSGSTYPTSIELQTRPGAIAVVPFDQPVNGTPKRALSYVPAMPILAPHPLPQNLEVVHSSLALYSTGDVSGRLLVFVPEDASGTINFTLAAYGDGRGQLASLVGFRTRTQNVKIIIDGVVSDALLPSLTGVWREGGRVWTFHDGRSSTLEIQNPSGETKQIRYTLYPERPGRWFLIEPDPRGAAFWVEFDGAGTLSVSHPGEDFSPFAHLIRQ